MRQWLVFFEMCFWPNYIACCTACKEAILLKNPYPDYPIIQIQEIMPGTNALEKFKCVHNFGGVQLAAG